jgi:hypothetical protein
MFLKWEKLAGVGMKMGILQNLKKKPKKLENSAEF